MNRTNRCAKCNRVTAYKARLCAKCHTHYISTEQEIAEACQKIREAHYRAKAAEAR